MIKHPLHVFALGAAVLLGAATEVSAGSCCSAFAVVPVLVPAEEIYVVNQGPVYSGPGPFVTRVPDPKPPVYPGAFPYVGFVYSGYPYGYYRPWIGGPYADPMTHRVVRRYVHERFSYRPVRHPAIGRHGVPRIIHVSK